MCDVDQIINEINELADIFLQCKSFFPFLDDSMAGKTYFKTAPYYEWKGYGVIVQTGQPITKDFIDKYRKIGNWINENAIIRLFGILHYHKQVGYDCPIDYSLSGSEQVRHCCFIRNVITKTRLNYEPDTDSKRNIELIKELISSYKLELADYENGEIPTPVGKVVMPIFDGCIEYLRAKDKST